MRKLILTLAAVAAASPALAQAQAFEDPRDAEIARSLPSRGEMEAMTHGLDRALAAILNMDVRPLRDAIDPLGRGRYDARERTLRDVAGRDDPYFEDRLRTTLYGTSAGMGQMMQALAAATPVLRRSLEDAARNVEDAMRRGGEAYDRGDGRYDDRRYDRR
jgi:hypothetical protein